MPDNEAELGARLSLTTDQAANAQTSAALKAAQAQTDALAAANGQAAAASTKAANAAKEQAAATKTVADVLKEIDRQKSVDNLATSWAKVAAKTKDAAAALPGGDYAGCSPAHSQGQ